MTEPSPALRCRPSPCPRRGGAQAVGGVGGGREKRCGRRSVPEEPRERGEGGRAGDAHPSHLSPARQAAQLPPTHRGVLPAP